MSFNPPFLEEQTRIRYAPLLRGILEIKLLMSSACGHVIDKYSSWLLIGVRRRKPLGVNLWNIILSSMRLSKRFSSKNVKKCPE